MNDDTIYQRIRHAALTTFVVVFMTIVFAVPCFAENSGYRWTPFQLSMWLEPEEIQLFPYEWTLYGLGVGLWTANDLVYGIQIGGASMAKTMNGIQLGIISGTEGMHGIQFGGLMNYNTGNTIGLQVGSVQFSDHMRGVQVGGMNVCNKTMAGVQIGILNHAKNAVGVQIGILNHAETAVGVQIGVLNGIDNSPVPRLPIINIHF